MNGPVLFSIIMPTYNRAGIIRKTINSLLEQSYQNFEIIVVDDGSTDNTQDVILATKDTRIRYYKKENEERGAARNFGVAMAKGCYINYFDSDDLAYPSHLQTAFDVINRNNTPEIIHLGYDYKTEDGKLLKSINRFDGNVVKYVVKKKMVSMMSLFIRKDIAEQFPFEEDRNFIMGEDALQLCHLVARYRFIYDNRVTSSVIVHKDRSMVNTSDVKLNYSKAVMLEGLKKDQLFMNSYGQYLDHIGREYDYLIWMNSLHNHDNGTAYKYYRNYVRGGYKNIISIRSMVFFKKYIYNIFNRQER